MLLLWVVKLCHYIGVVRLFIIVGGENRGGKNDGCQKIFGWKVRRCGNTVVASTERTADVSRAQCTVAIEEIQNRQNSVFHPVLSHRFSKSGGPFQWFSKYDRGNGCGNIFGDLNICCKDLDLH